MSKLLTILVLAIGLTACNDRESFDVVGGAGAAHQSNHFTFSNILLMNASSISHLSGGGRLRLFYLFYFKSFNSYT